MRSICQVRRVKRSVKTSQAAIRVQSALDTHLDRLPELLRHGRAVEGQAVGTQAATSLSKI